VALIVVIAPVIAVLAITLLLYFAWSWPRRDAGRALALIDQREPMPPSQHFKEFKAIDPRCRARIISPGS